MSILFVRHILTYGSAVAVVRNMTRKNHFPLLRSLFIMINAVKTAEVLITV